MSKETEHTSYENQGFEVSKYKGIPIYVSDSIVKRWRWLPKWFPYNKRDINANAISKMYTINLEHLQKQPSFSMSSKNHNILWKELSGIMLCFCETCDIRWSFEIDYNLENPLKKQILNSHPEAE